MKHAMKHKRRGMLITIYGESDADDRKLRRAARKFNLRLQAGFGHCQVIFDISAAGEEGALLVLVMKYLFGEHLGWHLAGRLLKSTATQYNLKKEE